MLFFNNFLFKLPLSSSSHSWNVTNHFSNQTTTHAAHSNTQLNYEFFNYSNAIQNPYDKHITINVDNELRYRHFRTGIPYLILSDSCARATCKHRQMKMVGYAFDFIAHFIGKYHVISYVVIGITFYAILFYFIFWI